MTREAHNLSVSGQIIHKKPSLLWLTGAHQNEDAQRTKTEKLIKLQALHAFSKKLMIYVLPAMQLWSLRSSTTNTEPKAFKITLAWLHLSFEHAVWGCDLGKSSDS